MRNKTTFGWVAALALLSVTLACGLGKPSYDKPPTEAEAVSQIRSWITEDTADYRRLTSGRKVNGEYVSIKGQQCYRMQIEFVLEYTQDCYLVNKWVFGTISHDTVHTDQELASLDPIYRSRNYVAVSAGEQFTLTFEPTWKWTDNGWVRNW